MHFTLLTLSPYNSPPSLNSVSCNQTKSLSITFTSPSFCSSTMLLSKLRPFATDDDTASSNLPIREIPGTYGLPFIGAIIDRLNYFYLEGTDSFFQNRIDKYRSTVFRFNMVPGPFISSNPRVIALLDAKSFRVLFDNNKVEKKNLFIGTFMPSTAYFGGRRVCGYLDPTEPKHAVLKQIIFNLLAARKSSFIPAFQSVYSFVFDRMESQIAGKGSSDFNKLNDEFAFEFLGEAFFGVNPCNTKLSSTGGNRTTKWIFLQLCPLITLGLPKILEELLLHTIKLPFCLVRGDYKAIYKYFEEAAAPVVDTYAQRMGLPKDELCHNLLFTTCFNTYGGMKVLFPGILKWIANAGPGLHAQLAQEIRTAVREAGGVTLLAIEKMELTKSVVYEALRMDPPVKFSQAKAKQDLIVESHDAAYKVKKGEILFAYQPFATMDEKVFENAKEFVPDRFVGEKGKELLKYLVWSFGPETEAPTVDNKQCAGKDFVVLISRLLLIEFFLRYDTFTADVGTLLLGAQVTMKSVKKATTS